MLNFRLTYIFACLIWTQGILTKQIVFKHLTTILKPTFMLKLTFIAKKWSCLQLYKCVSQNSFTVRWRSKVIKLQKNFWTAVYLYLFCWPQLWTYFIKILQMINWIHGFIIHTNLNNHLLYVTKQIKQLLCFPAKLEASKGSRCTDSIRLWAFAKVKWLDIFGKLCSSNK